MGCHKKRHGIFYRRIKKAEWVVSKSCMGFLSGEQKKLFKRRKEKSFLTGEQKKRRGLSEKAAWDFL